MPLTLEQLNSASQADAAHMLDGLYEHSPWIAEQALAQRPFTSLAHLKHAMCEVLAQAVEHLRGIGLRCAVELFQSDGHGCLCGRPPLRPNVFGVGIRPQGRPPTKFQSL